MNILLTVIITVYNIAPYISRCIESVMAQTYENIEILLIDDGSTDGSGSICDAYACKDKRITVYHRKNLGLVSARKFGAGSASGEIITFVDGDDWIESDMYEHMVAAYAKEKPEMVTSRLTYEWKDKKKIDFDSVMEGVYERESIQQDILPRAAYDLKAGAQGITASVCNKLFYHAALKKVIKNIDPKITIGEDGIIVYLLIAQADKIVIINRSWYHYVQHDNSMLRTYSVDTFEKLYRLKNCFMEEYKKIGLENKMKAQVDYYVKSCIRPAIESLYGFDLREITYLFPYEDVPKNSRIILYGAGKVGRSYWKCLQSEDYAELAGWVDKNYMKLREFGLPTEPLEEALSKEFDFIIIAINDEAAAEEVKNVLLGYGIRIEKIIWRKRREII